MEVIIDFVYVFKVRVCESVYANTRLYDILYEIYQTTLTL